MVSHSGPVDTPNHNQPRYSAPVSFQSIASFRQYVNRIGFFLTLSLFLSRVSTASEAVSVNLTTLALPNNIAYCNVQTCLPNASFDPNADYFPVKVELEDASLFTVTYFPSYKIVSIPRVNERYVLYQCGTPRPVSNFTYSSHPNAIYPINNLTTVIYPSWVDSSTVKIFQLPLTNFALDETVPVTFFELLGARTAIHYIDTYVTSGCVKSMAANNQTQNFPSAYSDSASLSVRASAIANTEAVVGSVTGSTNAKIVADVAVYENTILARSEWVKYFGSLMNREAAAHQIYSGIKSRYRNSQAAASVASSKFKPVVVWLHSDFSSNFSTEFYLTSYRYAVLADAGCSGYLPAGLQVGSTYTFSNLTQLHAALVAAAPDAIIDESYFVSSIPTFAQVLTNLGLNGTQGGDDWNALPFLRKNAVFRIDGLLSDTGAEDWFEGGVALSDMVLNDIIRICQPSSLPVGYQFRWFRNVANSETTSKIVNTCPNNNPAAPLIDPEQALTDAPTSCPNWLLNPTQFGQQQPTGAVSSTGAGVGNVSSSSTGGFLIPNGGAIKINPAGKKWINMGMAMIVIIGAMMMM